jgi:hypothetical protein
VLSNESQRILPIQVFISRSTPQTHPELWVIESYTEWIPKNSRALVRFGRRERRWARDKVAKKVGTNRGVLAMEFVSARQSLKVGISINKRFTSGRSSAPSLQANANGMIQYQPGLKL